MAKSKTIKAWAIYKKNKLEDICLSRDEAGYMALVRKISGKRKVIPVEIKILK